MENTTQYAKACKALEKRTHVHTSKTCKANSHIQNQLQHMKQTCNHYATTHGAYNNIQRITTKHDTMQQHASQTTACKNINGAKQQPTQTKQTNET